MRTLHLTMQEQVLFDTLPDALREGWETEAETLSYEDTPQRRMIRLSLLRLHDPKLLAFREQAKQAQSAEEIAVLMESIDLKDVDEGDLAELFFALGPVTLSLLIAALLRTVKTDTDIEGITALTVIRHSVLASLQPVSR